MIEHRYILQPYKGVNTRYYCPICNKGKTFSRYIDTRTGDHLASNVGRCDRESNCGYHYTPKQYFQDNDISIDTTRLKLHAIPKPVYFIPVELFKQSLKDHSENNFVVYLTGLFGNETTSELIRCYFIGSSNHWSGSTIFWQIDITGKIRTGKIMLYNPVTGKRVKEPFNHIAWAHTAPEMAEFDLTQCFFGEHLLLDKTKPVAIVESEKTAIIASVYLRQFIWLAAGSKEGLKNIAKCKVLKGRTVVLFPDLKAYKDWTDRAKDLSTIARVNVSDLLERKANETEREQGLDLADYLIRFDYKTFINAEQTQEPVLPNHELEIDSEPESIPEINLALPMIGSKGNDEPIMGEVPGSNSKPETSSAVEESDICELTEILGEAFSASDITVQYDEEPDPTKPEIQKSLKQQLLEEGPLSLYYHFSADWDNPVLASFFHAEAKPAGSM